MRKILYIILFFNLATMLTGSKFKPRYPFYIYKGKIFNESLPYKPSSWIGNYPSLELNINCTNFPKTNKYCMKFTYYPKKKAVFNWVGVYWTFPAYNWGNIDGGYNLNGAKELSFWIKSNSGPGSVSVQIGGNYGRYSDTETINTGTINFNSKWKKITIPIKKEYDMSHISRGFSIIIRASDYENITNQLKINEKIIFYLDDIKYK